MYLPIKTNEIMVNDNFFIGREEQQKAIQAHLNTNRASLVAVLGRRRVGKTYFVKHILKDKSYFHFTGIQHESKERLLKEFSIKVNESIESKIVLSSPTDWYEAFRQLKNVLEANHGNQKKIIFLDEFPWMETHASSFLSAFEYFWNDWAVNQNVLIIICGSSTSWMIKNVINNKSGLHNRVSEYFKIQPFTLKETEQFLQKKNISLSRYDIAQLYMAMGGVPHYLDMIKKGESFAICIDRLFYDKDAPLNIEYNNLFKALFTHYQNYELLVETLAKKRKGLTRQEIIDATELSNGGGITKIITELEECSFIRFQVPFSQKNKDGLYMLNDEYCLFYHHFIRKNIQKGQFISIFTTPKVRSWMGLAFELLCIKHESNIKKALGISGVYTESCSFTLKSTDEQPGFQIDMMIDRADQTINICEMKFYNQQLTLSQKEADTLRERKARFQNYTKTKKNVMLTMVTPFGVQENKHSLSVIDNAVVLDDLF
jgi:hypothetical protein